jgi:predicted GNAT family acetyltransferase
MAVENHPELERFVLPVAGAEPAYIDYSLGDDGTVNLLHAEVPTAARGRRVGSDLVRGTLELARREGLRVAPICPFVAAWVRRHPEFGDVIAER